jgi:lipoate-protein ligase A
MRITVVDETGVSASMPGPAGSLYDAGLGSGESHVRRDARLLAAHAAGEIGDRLIFHCFQPTASIGVHQAEEREIRLSYCHDAGIGIVRRPTAGGALYLDPGQLCFSLAVPAHRLGRTVAERIETGAAMVAAGLANLDVGTSFKAPNDLQVDGRQKIASVFLAELDGSALLFATVIVTLDLRSAMQALLVPTEKLTVTGLEHAKERMTSLAEVLGQAPSPAAIQKALAAAIEHRLGLPFVDGGEAPDDASHRAAALPPCGEWTLAGNRFETKDKVPGATLRLLLDLSEGGQATSLRFATDAHFAPVTALVELAAHLAGASIGDFARQCGAWFDAHPIDAAGFSSGDVVRLVERAASKWALQDRLGLTPAQSSGLMLAGEGRDAAKTLEQASVMLVPYCAKPNWCKWRHTIDCVECGMCEVGDAYIMARERNMEVITIINFEHLSETLGKMKSAGVQSYVGMCCGEFFLKRHHAFRDSGMDAVLLDIEGATCYELKEEHLAYAGAFKAEAKLDLDAVRKVMAQVPSRPVSQRPCITGLARRPGESRHDAGGAGGCGSCGCGKAVVAKT